MLPSFKPRFTSSADRKTSFEFNNKIAYTVGYGSKRNIRPNYSLFKGRCFSCGSKILQTSELAATETDQPVTETEVDALKASFASQYEEYAGFIEWEDIEGEVPRELCGTLLRNGPGIFEIGGKSIPQPFDADGLVAALSFPGNGSRPYFANRIVRTEAFVEEQQAGRMLYRGAFSVGNPAGGFFFNPFDFSIKKVANTGILWWANRIMALYERDLPYEVNVPDLRTEGKTDLEGSISGSDYFAAHYRIVEDDSKVLIGFSSSESGLDNRILVWEIDEDGRQVHQVDVTIPGAAFGFFHDFAVTEDSYIFIENPVELDFIKLFTKYMFGKACIAECLQYKREKPVKVHVISRSRNFPEDASNSRLQTYIINNSFFSFHHANAFQTGDNIIIDTVALPDGFDFSSSINSLSTAYFKKRRGSALLTRLTINSATGEVTSSPLMSRACEFPSVSPSVASKPHRHIYLSGSRPSGPKYWGPTQVVIKATFDNDSYLTATPKVSERLYFPGSACIVGEPIFVPRDSNSNLEEDDGWVLIVIYDKFENRSMVKILEAKTMNLVTSIRLPVRLPYGLHGSWTSSYRGPQMESIDKIPKRYNIKSGGPLRYE